VLSEEGQVWALVAGCAMDLTAGEPCDVLPVHMDVGSPPTGTVNGSLGGAGPAVHRAQTGLPTAKLQRGLRLPIEPASVKKDRLAARSELHRGGVRAPARAPRAGGEARSHSLCR
jgi:hypothetical protein